MSRLVFVNRFYWPEEPATAQLLTDLAEGLAQSGRPVHVITSHPGPAGVPEREERAGVSIQRLRSSRWHGGGAVIKALNFGAFIQAARAAMAEALQPGDTLVMLTDPPLLGAFAAGIARQRGARLVHWLHDIYPEIPAAVGATRLPLALRPWRDRSWRQATTCVAISDDMAAYVQSRGVAAEKVCVIENWAPRGLAAAAPADVEAVRAAWGVGDRFVVGYSGNLGRVHALEPIINVAEALRTDPRIVLVIVGGGARRPHLEEEVRQRNLTNVRFLASQPRERLAATLAAADVHLVSVRGDCDRFVFPSKLYGITAVGRPLVALGNPDGSLGRIVRDERLGFTFNPGDTAALAAVLQRLASQPAERAQLGAHASAYHARSGFEKALAAWTSLVDSQSRLPAPGETRS